LWSKTPEKVGRSAAHWGAEFAAEPKGVWS
jgi:hypothetical protein